MLKLLTGTADANFDLDNLIQLLLRLGFEEKRTSGSHRIFLKDGVVGILNLQKTKNGKAKTYQVKQVRDFLVNNKLINNESEL